MNYANQTKHTPGPWVGLIHSTDKGIQIIGGHTIVAVVPTLFDEPWAKANARLIAAAPELLALLDEVRKNFTRDDDLPDNLLPRIDTAIAKATEGP